MNNPFLGTVLMALVGLITGCTYSPLDAQFKTLCETEAGIEIVQTPTPQRSILFRPDLVNRIDDNERSFGVGRSGCRWLCQKWLKEGVFEFAEAEIDVGTGVSFDLVPPPLRQKGNHLIYSLEKVASGAACIAVDNQMPDACIVVRPSGAPVSTYYFRYRHSVVANADKASIFKQSQQIRTMRDDALVASVTEFVHTWPSSLSGSGRSGAFCPKGGVPFPIDLIRRP